jgi:co-chaperonin GroES (HSP10)
MTPYGKRIAIKPTVKTETTLSNGLVVPNASFEKDICTGVAQFIGHEETHIKEGNTIGYAKGSGISLKYNDEDLLLLSPHEIVYYVTTKNN